MPRRVATIVRRCFIVLVLLMPLISQGQNALSSYTQQQTEFLPVDAAYQLTVVADGDRKLLLQWVIAPEYYLYRHAFKATAEGGEGLIEADLIIPNGLAKTDEFFGDRRHTQHRGSDRARATHRNLSGVC